MIRTLDSRLVAAAQWVVDLTQRQPHTLGGLSVALSAVLCCARAGLFALFRSHGIRDSLDVVAFACLVAFPCLCVLAARHLP